MRLRLVVLLALLLTAASAWAQEPIRVGFITILTGPLPSQEEEFLKRVMVG